MGPAVGAYDVGTYDKHARRSFSSDKVLGRKTPGGFGSAAPRATAKEQQDGGDAPGPGAYHTGASPPSREAQRPSAAFASASRQRGASPLPMYDSTTYVPEGMGSKALGKPNMGFGGAARGLALDEQAEVAALRELLGKA